MGVVNKKIGSGTCNGLTCDYSSLSTWESAIPTNLVTDGNAQVAELFNDSEFLTGGANLLTLSGHTTSSTDSITVRCYPGQSFADSGLATTLGPYNVSWGVGVRDNTGGGYYNAFTVNDSNVIINGIQFSATRGVGGSVAIGASSGTPKFVVSQCLFDFKMGNGAGIVGNAGGTNLLNVIIDRSTVAAGTAFSMQFTGSSTTAYNTFIRPSDVAGSSSHQAIRYSYSGSSTLTGNAFFGYQTPITSDHGTITSSHNATDVASFGGTVSDTGSLFSKTFSSQFNNVTSASVDLTLKTGADCIDAGVTDTTDITSSTCLIGTAPQDIFGTSRPQGSAWDIGAYEKASGGGGTTTQPAHSRNIWFGVLLPFLTMLFHR